jgi:hypothetical protein
MRLRLYGHLGKLQLLQLGAGNCKGDKGQQDDGGGGAVSLLSSASLLSLPSLLLDFCRAAF